MKRLMFLLVMVLVSAAAVCVSGAQLHAEGLNSKRKALAEPGWVPSAIAATTSTNWTGGYVGVHGATSPYAGDDTGWDAGGQVGYNWHWQGGVVLGLEIDASKSWLKQQFECGKDCEARRELEWSGSVRARLGWATGTVLAYGTAGVGFQNLRDSVDDTEGVVRERGWAAPWIYGAGFEVRATERVSAKAEWLRFQGEAVDTGTEGIDQDVFRVGLNYKLN